MNVIITFEVPIRIESEANQRVHWSKRWRRFRDQRIILRNGWNRATNHAGKLNASSYVVTLTRIGHKLLDDDNLAGGLKGVQDEIAKILGIDDGDARIKWVRKQRKGTEYSCVVKIEARTELSDEAVPF